MSDTSSFRVVGVNTPLEQTVQLMHKEGTSAAFRVHKNSRPRSGTPSDLTTVGLGLSTWRSQHTNHHGASLSPDIWERDVLKIQISSVFLGKNVIIGLDTVLEAF